MKNEKNIDIKVVNDFGREWNKFNYDSIEGSEELRIIFNDYFSLFPWEILKDDSCGFDLGCGTGRWAFFASEKVKELHCIDPSAEALNVAKKILLIKKIAYYTIME